MYTGSIHQEEATTINVYAPHAKPSGSVKQTLMDLKGETDSNTIIVGVVNTTLTSMDRLKNYLIHYKTETQKETTQLTRTLEKMHLVDFY